ncbi:hypothetical protein GCM10010218_21090 [Streptomyces mashuensis]|uniref:Uncharacterized protein n=1 Tax=Streptomyces mashuensis TaxID=33904 RepID=A0A919B1M9_9ACTN|nr:hypothetical protein GCM10010218_21090 [Streptomyces mashuensis]
MIELTPPPRGDPEGVRVALHPREYRAGPVSSSGTTTKGYAGMTCRTPPATYCGGRRNDGEQREKGVEGR